MNYVRSSIEIRARSEAINKTLQMLGDRLGMKVPSKGSPSQRREKMIRKIQKRMRD